MKRAHLLRGPVARVSVRGRATGNGRRQDEYLARLSRVSLGTPGRCAHRPAVVIGVFDDSGSVTGGNDAVGHRYDEMYFALAKVGRRCTCGKCLAAIIHFDVPTDADVAATPISRKGIEKVKDGLRVPSRPASSNLGPALDAAYGVANSYAGSHVVVLVVATDFELFDVDKAGVLQRLVDFPGDVHALVLNTEPPAVLTDHPATTVTKVDPRSAIGEVTKCVFATITRHRVGAKPAQQPTSPYATNARKA